MIKAHGLVQPDPEITSLAEATQPDMLIQQIEQSLEHNQQEETAPEKPPQTP